MIPTEEWVFDNYEIQDFKNALLQLKSSNENEWNEIKSALYEFKLLKSEIIADGGNKTLITHRMEAPFKANNWEEVKAKTYYKTDIGTRMGTRKESILATTEKTGSTHKIDLFKNGIGVEIEWNSKDGVFSRDLEAFRTLYDMDAIKVGLIITRQSKLQATFDRLGVGGKYGKSTTHMEKVVERIRSSVIGCPILVIGITDKLFIEDI